MLKAKAAKQTSIVNVFPYSFFTKWQAWTAFFSMPLPD